MLSDAVTLPKHRSTKMDSINVFRVRKTTQNPRRRAETNGQSSEGRAVQFAVGETPICCVQVIPFLEAMVFGRERD